MHVSSLSTSLKSFANVLSWLGPWRSDLAMPQQVVRRTIKIPAVGANERPFDAWLYAPSGSRPAGAYLVVPGLFPTGPQDRRLDRISRILAAAGMLVLTPFLPDYIALRLVPTVIRDVERAFAALLEHPELPARALPGVLSLSFGSLPALRLASSPELCDRLGSLVVWGGYADWRETMHFAFTGQANGQQSTSYDPTNHPVIFINLVDRIPGSPADPEPLRQAWLRFVISTWNQPEQKARFREVAQELAEELPADLRELFLIGCGARPGGYELCMDVLSRSDSESHLDARPHLGRIRCPVHLVHAQGDDVIPATQLTKLAEAMPSHVKVTRHLTGLYGHSGGRGQGGGGLSLRPAMLREVLVMSNILLALSQAGLHRH